MTQPTRPKSSGKPVALPAMQAFTTTEVLSIGVNLNFQAALRSFLEAQKLLAGTKPMEAGYAEQERSADAATAALIRTIDEFIERRRSRTEQPSAPEPQSRAGKQTTARTTKGPHIMNESVLNSNEKVLNSAMEARLRALLEARPAARMPRIVEEATGRDRVVILAYIATALAAASSGHFSQQELRDVDWALGEEKPVSAREAAVLRALNRHRHLVIRLVWNGCRQRGEV